MTIACLMIKYQPVKNYHSGYNKISYSKDLMCCLTGQQQEINKSPLQQNMINMCSHLSDRNHLETRQPGQ